MRKPKKYKLKPSYTIKTCLAEMETIKVNYKKVQKGARDEFRKTMELTQRLIFRFLDNEKLQAKFKRAVLDERKLNGDRHSNSKFNLSLEVVAKATGALSRKARKIASKRAKALDCLRKAGVGPADTARTIKSKGGLDKILAEAANLKPTFRRGRKPATAAENANGKSPPVGANDKEVPVPIWMKL
jgi:hypothetical protein